jgi:TonB family protein
MTLRTLGLPAVLACACVLAVATPVASAAQVPLVADSSEIPALEHDAVAPDGTAPAPRRVRHVEPVWPRPVTEPWRFRLHLVLEADGRVGTSRIVQVLVGDPKARPVGAFGDIEEAVRDTPTARAGLAVLAATRQWRYEKPRKVPMLIVTDVGIEDVATVTAERPSSGRPPLRIGDDMRPPRKLHDVPPVYPPDAIAARITGTIVIEATIGTTGAVEDARVVSGVPMLDDPALDAVRQWRYTPTLLNGEPVPVIMTVTVKFSLGR